MGGVVAGVVMLANGGAKARGALLRDVGAYAAAVGLLTAFLASGAMTLDKSAALLAMYGGFVLLVLGADLWHICFGRHVLFRTHACLADKNPALAGKSLPRTCSLYILSTRRQVLCQQFPGMRRA